MTIFQARKGLMLLENLILLISQGPVRAAEYKEPVRAAAYKKPNAGGIQAYAQGGLWVNQVVTPQAADLRSRR